MITDYPTPEQIADWRLRVLHALPAAPHPWAIVEWCHGCDYCGAPVVSPVERGRYISDGDDAICIGCGLVASWSVDVETAPHLQDAHAVLSLDALAGLRGVLGVPR